MDPQLEQELYDEIRSTFTPLEFSTAEELMEIIAGVFTSSDHWTDCSEYPYLEPMYGDASKPLLRLAEQKPSFSKVTFTMDCEDIDRSITRYAEDALTTSRGHLLTINSAMTSFFIQFGLLPECLVGKSREKTLRVLPEMDKILARKGILPSRLYYADLEYFNLSPVVLCGALRPSELLDRAQGRSSVVVFPYQGTGLDEDYRLSVTAFLLEFPQPIEPVITVAEAFRDMSVKLADLGIDFSKKE